MTGPQKTEMAVATQLCVQFTDLHGFSQNYYSICRYCGLKLAMNSIDKQDVAMSLIFGFVSFFCVCR